MTPPEGKRGLCINTGRESKGGPDSGVSPAARGSETFLAVGATGGLFIVPVVFCRADVYTRVSSFINSTDGSPS